jgi:hypothetical protein
MGAHLEAAINSRFRFLVTKTDILQHQIDVERSQAITTVCVRSISITNNIAHEIRHLHWENNVRPRTIRIRFLFPGVANRVAKETLLFILFSIVRERRICSISKRTRGFRSSKPTEWKWASILAALLS